MSFVKQSDPRLFSTWTPLNNEQRNREVFVQRKELFLKWFEKWSAPQRKKIIDDVLSLSNESQLHYINAQVSSRISMKDDDFTRALPRVISLYIFSFLDPRTLCRCAQVCWYWKYLSELDQLWMLKCLRLGWNLSFTPSPYEQGLWKRNYVENYQSLQYLRQQVVYTPPTEDFSQSAPLSSCGSSRADSSLSVNQDHHIAPASCPAQHQHHHFHHYYHIIHPSPHPDAPFDQVLIESASNTATPRSARSLYGSKQSQGPRPAWRGSDPVPKDTLRYNYLNNTDQVETVKMLRNHSALLKQSKQKKPGKKTHDMTVLPDNRMITMEKSVRVVEEGPAGLRNHNLTYGERPTWAKSQDSKSYPHSPVDDSKLVNDLTNLKLKGGNRNRDYITSEQIKSDVVQLPVDGKFEVFTTKPWKIPEPADDD